MIKDTQAKSVPSAKNVNLAGTPGFENEGEGNKTAARRYNDAQQAYVKSGRAESAAKQAAEAVDSAEGDDLRAAEAIGLEGEPPVRSQDSDDEEESINSRPTEPDLTLDNR